MTTELTGISACPGFVRGSAFVIDSDVTDCDKMESGQILVVKYSSPEYFEFYLKAAAIVTELGGATCHAASLSRDLNIPCVVSVQNAIKFIRTGDDIIVDANAGRIYV